MPKKLGERAAEDAAESARRRLSPGLESKTVNTHRMLHRAWEDFTTWGCAKRNVVSDAHPPRVPRQGELRGEVPAMGRSFAAQLPSEPRGHLSMHVALW
jgi:hypothetical protein